MKFIILLAFSIGCTVVTSDVNTDNYYDMAIFNDEIDAKCLGRLKSNTYGARDYEPSGLTLEAFISYVELVERNQTTWSIYDVTKALLRRFAFEGMEFTIAALKRTARQNSDASRRWQIISKLLGPGITQFEEDDLGADEKCNMYFMMGHVVNATYREGKDNPDETVNVPSDTSNSQPAFRAPATKVSKKPREQGVISVNGNKLHAVSISKVLNAILATQNPVTVNVKDHYDIRVPYFPADQNIEPLPGITLGDILSLAAIHNEENSNTGKKYFGPGGEWDSAVCPKEYILNANATGSTNALLRGAVDGLLIGTAIQSWSGNVPGMKLSRVLRMYYSPEGLPDRNQASSGNIGYSYCKRSEKTASMSTDGIKKSARAFYHAHFALEYSAVSNDADAKIDDAYSNMIQTLSEFDDELDDDECKTPRADTITCETPSNLFVVLDGSEEKTKGFIEQEEVVGYLAHRLDFGGPEVGTLGIYENGEGQGGMLKEVKQNASNPTCATCAMTDLDRNAVNDMKEIGMLTRLNKTLQEFEKKTDLLPGVPNKVAVVMHFGDIQESDKNRLSKVVSILRDGHRDARVFVVGSNSDALAQITPNGKQDVITESSDPNRLGKNLADKICKVPAIFQFNRCWDHKRATRKEEENKYVGYVTPNHVQFWAFYPEYFLKSYDVKISFKAVHGDLSVCEERGNLNPGFNSNGDVDRRYCKKTTTSERELVFKFSNPCDKYDVHNCPPINFAIIGEYNSLQTLGCQVNGDDKCRRLDQVKFEVSHDGISCNGCLFLKGSSLLVFFIATLAYIMNRN